MITDLLLIGRGVKKVLPRICDQIQKNQRDKIDCAVQALIKPVETFLDQPPVQGNNTKLWFDYRYNTWLDKLILTYLIKSGSFQKANLKKLRTKIAILSKIKFRNSSRESPESQKENLEAVAKRIIIQEGSKMILSKAPLILKSGLPPSRKFSTSIRVAALSAMVQNFKQINKLVKLILFRTD